MNLPSRNASISTTICVVLAGVSAIFFASSFNAAPGKSEMNRSPVRAEPQPANPAPTESAMDDTNPTLGNYPDISVLLSTDATVRPDASPANTTAINVSTSTNFKGKLEGYPSTGMVRVTDAHPAGTYAVTVKAFNGSGSTTAKTFTLTVSTVMCLPLPA